MATVAKQFKRINQTDDHGCSKNKKSKIDKSEDGENWDIDNYRTEYESEEHWELRKKFMEVHKDKFPEERLVCLARVFTNIEFMGCRYPQETMRLVAELSKDVAQNYRDSRESHIKRTFVAASDAAEQRAKGRRQAQSQQQQQLNKKQQQNENNSRYVLGTSLDFFAGLPYNQFVLFLKGGRQCLMLSASRCKMKIDEKVVKLDTGSTKVELCLGTKVIASGECDKLKEAKALAFKNAVAELQKNCFCIKQNGQGDTIKIEKKDDNTVSCKILKEKKPDEKLDETNKGYKMMKKMGWSGGGLGSQKQGREDPVGYLFKNDRAGLGQSIDRQFLSDILKNYTNSDDIRELRFEPSFTKEERAILHQLAQKFNLKSNSYGGTENRHLVISRKAISNEQILREVLLHKNPAYCDQFHVQVPECKAHLYPDNTEHLDLAD